jgi:hypothetical protein
MSDLPLTITSTNGGVELVLADTSVTMKLSESVLQEARDEMQHDLQNDPDIKKGGLAARFAQFVTGAVEHILNHTIEYPLGDIESVHYQDSGLVFTYRKKQKLSFEIVNVDGKPALKTFSPEDAQAFVERFSALKQPHA